MYDLKLIAATYKDIDTISELAKEIWNQHYTSIITQAQIDYMLNLMYSSNSLTDQLENKKHCFYLIEVNKKNIGFISVNKENETNWFLNKFYINQLISAKGIGTKAWHELQKIIQPQKISLTVNRQNFKSINFYFKNGFKIERVADFDIGNDYVMNDFVMVWESEKK
jgi:ribosomal protein S18 acetylase RimI-like enzyme